MMNVVSRLLKWMWVVQLLISPSWLKNRSITIWYHYGWDFTPLLWSEFIIYYIYLEINSNQSCYINVLYTENYNLVNLVGYCIIKYIFLLYCKLHLGFSFTFSVGKKP